MVQAEGDEQAVDGAEDEGGQGGAGAEQAAQAPATAPGSVAPTPAPASGQEAPAPSQTLTGAREWLEDSADRRVRWVSAGDSGRNMAADKTIALDPASVAEGTKRRRKGRRSGATAPSDRTGSQGPSDRPDAHRSGAQGAGDAPSGPADSTHQLPRVDR